MEAGPTVEELFAEWRQHLMRHDSIAPDDVEELEDHLRSQIQDLQEAGLDEEEAFLLAVKRIGELNLISSEFAKEYSERLWKQLVISPGTIVSSPVLRLDAMVAVGLAIAAAFAIKIPELFGVPFAGEDGPAIFYFRNFSLFVLPFLATYFAWKRELDWTGRLQLAAPFLAGLILVNTLPFQENGDTLILAGIHLPIALWFAVGFAYVGSRWKNRDERMNFVRFSGEWFIYYALIAFGGGVLMMFTVFIFDAIALDSEPIVVSWILPCGIVGAVIVAAWLVEAKQSLIENMAPVLTRLFTPLFALLLLVFLATMIFTGKGIDIERDVLIGFDLLLVLVLALLLYSISARDSEEPPDLFDLLQLVLVVSTLLVDLLALFAISARISEFGFSPNKVAALGENLILLANLGWTAVLYTRFLLKRVSFARIERWQTAYLPVYAVWAWVVVAAFPIIFNFA